MSRPNHDTTTDCQQAAGSDTNPYPYRTHRNGSSPTTLMLGASPSMDAETVEWVRIAASARTPSGAKTFSSGRHTCAAVVVVVGAALVGIGAQQQRRVPRVDAGETADRFAHLVTSAAAVSSWSVAPSKSTAACCRWNNAVATSARTRIPVVSGSSRTNALS